jgi:hypothetical protein
VPDVRFRSFGGSHNIMWKIANTVSKTNSKHNCCEENICMFVYLT